MSEVDGIEHCCICGSGESEEGNAIVICDCCDKVAAHQGCYGIHDIPEGPWYCQVCSYFINEEGYDPKEVTSDMRKSLPCLVCPLRGGAMVRGYFNNKVCCII